MLFGYVDENSYTIKNDEDDPILGADYYFGTNEDGARHTGWLQYTDALTDKDEDYYWFYFNTSNGKKVKKAEKTINGKKYSFDDDGVMNFKWETASGSTDTQKWYGSLEDGSLAKNKWIWNKPYEDKDGIVYQEDSTKEDYDDETPRWFRTDASGNLIKGRTKKINSKWYVFDRDGVMRTGLVVLSDSEGAVSGENNYVYAYDMDEVTKNKLKEDDPGAALHYFSEDEEKDGAMKTGTLKIELADDEYTFCFAKTTGAAKDGYDKSSKKVYNNGILEKAGDDKYKVVTDYANGDDYLVGSTGSVVKTVSKYKDANDAYYIYLSKNNGKGWIILKTSNEDAAKAIITYKTDAMKTADEFDSYDEDTSIIVTDNKDKSYELSVVGLGWN